MFLQAKDYSHLLFYSNVDANLLHPPYIDCMMCAFYLPHVERIISIWYFQTAKNVEKFRILLPQVQLLKTKVSMWQPVNICVSVSVGWAVSNTAHCTQRRWASGSPCGNAPGGRRSGTPDHRSVPARTKTHIDNELKLWGQLLFFSPHTGIGLHVYEIQPVHVDQPAVGVARWIPPYHWGHTDRRRSCSLWPRNPHRRWEETLPALFLTWDEETQSYWEGKMVMCSVY